MKLTLIDFKCYHNKTFDLGSSGITLISGQSGKGKSSIVDAVFFALYGEGKHLVRIGAKGCEVRLEIDNLKIIRKKKPNCLLVNDKFHDLEGESVIKEHFHFMFEHTGYIKQNSVKSFIYMSPLDKLKFIEKFAFKNANIVKCKKHIDDDIKQLLKQDIVLHTKNNTFENILKDEKENINEKVSKPTITYNDNFLEQMYQLKSKNNENITKYTEETTIINEKKKQKDNLLSDINVLINNIKTLPSIQKVEQTITKDDIMLLENEITKHKINIQKCENTKLLLDKYIEQKQYNINRIIILKNKKKNIKKVEKPYLESNIDIIHIKNILEKLKTKLQTLEQKLHKIKLYKVQVLDENKKIDKIKLNIQTKQKELEKYNVDSNILCEYEKDLLYLKKYQKHIEHLKQKNNIKELINNEIKNKKTQLEDIKKNLWHNISRKITETAISENKYQIVQFNTIKNKLNKNKFEANYYNKLKHEIDVIKLKLKKDKIKTCPCCNKQLIFDNDILVETNDEFDKLSNDYKKQIITLLENKQREFDALNNDKIIYDNLINQLLSLKCNENNIEDIEKKNKELIKYYEENMINENKYKRIQDELVNNKYSVTLRTQLETNNKEDEYYSNFNNKKYNKLNITDIETLTNKITELKSNNIYYNNICESINHYKNESNLLESTKIMLETHIKDEKNVTDKYNSKKNKKNRLDEQVKRYDVYELKENEYKYYMETLINYEKNISELDEENNDIDKRLESYNNNEKQSNLSINKLEELKTKLVSYHKLFDILTENDKIHNITNNYEKNIGNIKNNIDELDTYINSESEMKEQLKNSLEERDNIETNIRNYHLYVKEKDNYEKYIKYKKNIDDISDKILKNKNERNSNLNMISTHELLRDRIKDAENISIQHILSQLNVHVQKYINLLFEDDPLTLNIKTFREDKKIKKPSINIEIEYKNYKTNINNLSGGEQSRINIAFTLAFAEIYNFKIILLDECVSNLDEELTNIVVETLHDYFSDNLVIMIAHQVVTGQFNKTIKI